MAEPDKETKEKDDKLAQKLMEELKAQGVDVEKLKQDPAQAPQQPEAQPKAPDPKPQPVAETPPAKPESNTKNAEEKQKENPSESETPKPAPVETKLPQDVVSLAKQLDQQFHENNQQFTIKLPFKKVTILALIILSGIILALLSWFWLT